MWLMIFAVAATLLLFWHKVAFPLEEIKETDSYSIIIPARNEAENLKRLLPSILAHSSIHQEVLVVDDDSDDNTSEIARSYGVKVVIPPPIPSDWQGKSWACYHGAKEASGKTLFFLDADTWFSPDGPNRIIQFAEAQEKECLITIHPYHEMHSFWEKLSSIFHMIVFLSSGITNFFRNRMRTHGGFGPCLIIKADTYWKLEGHYAIRGEIVEHLALARRAGKKKVKTFAYSGKKAVHMRMYPPRFSAVVNGWSKSFASGARTASPILSIASIIWVSLIISFLVNMIHIGWWSSITYVILSCLLYRFLKQVGTFYWYDAALFPVHFFFFVIVFVYSFLNSFLFKQTTWKGRQIAGNKGKDSS